MPPPCIACISRHHVTGHNRAVVDRRPAHFRGCENRLASARREQIDDRRGQTHSEIGPKLRRPRVHGICNNAGLPLSGNCQITKQLARSSIAFGVRYALVKPCGCCLCAPTFLGRHIRFINPLLAEASRSPRPQLGGVPHLDLGRAPVVKRPFENCKQQRTQLLEGCQTLNYVHVHRRTRHRLAVWMAAIGRAWLASTLQMHEGASTFARLATRRNAARHRNFIERHSLSTGSHAVRSIQ
jgi:hypothetical protein